MIDDSNGYLDSSDTQLELPPPRFDEHASASAQPVEPIPAQPRAISARRSYPALATVQIKRKAFALLLLAGMAIGALGGTLLVKERRAGSETAAVPNTVQGVTADVEGREPTNENLDGLANALQDSRKRDSRIRSRHSRHQRLNLSQAYRVGVIR